MLTIQVLKIATLTIKVKPFAYIVLFQVIILLVAVVLLLLAAIGGGVAVFLTTSFKDEELQSGNFFPTTLHPGIEFTNFQLIVRWDRGELGHPATCRLEPAALASRTEQGEESSLATNLNLLKIYFCSKGEDCGCAKQRRAMRRIQDHWTRWKQRPKKSEFSGLQTLARKKLYRKIKSELNNKHAQKEMLFLFNLWPD